MQFQVRLRSSWVQRAVLSEIKTVSLAYLYVL